jgi:tetratricopeptide (TPR) repeat protein
VVFKKLFGGSGEKTAPTLDIDDLIVLERYQEAEDRLKAKLKLSPNDLHSHVKLAEVYTAVREVAKAVDAYIYAAEEYSDDGFYDKAVALLAKAAKLAPLDSSLPQRIERLEQKKRLEHTREMAIEGLHAQRRADDATRPISPIDAQQIWQDLAESALVRRLGAEQTRRLFAAMTTLRLAAAAVITERGSREEQLYIVSRGRVEVVAPVPAGTTVLRSFGGGDVFGEAALFERRPWPAQYRAADKVVLLRLDRAGLEQTLLGNSDPRGLIDALRDQRHDQVVAAAVAKLEAMG